MQGIAMPKNSRINPNLLTVYASLAFVIGALITLAASIISYRSGQAGLPDVADIIAGESLVGIR